MSCDRAHVDNPAVAALPHSRKHQLAKPGKAEDIHLYLPAGIFHGGALQRRKITISGVVDEHIHGPGRSHASLHGRLVADIQVQGDDTVGLQRLHQGCPAGGRINGVSFAGKGAGCVKSDSTAGAGDKDYHKAG